MGGYLSNLANLSSISHAAAPSSSAAKIMPLRSKSQKRISAKAIKKIVSSLELSKEGATARRMNAESAARSNSALAEGKDFLLQKEYSEAISCFTSALKANRGNLEAKFYRGICFLDSGSTRKAIQEFSEIIEVQPDFKRTVYVVLSIAFRRVNDIVGALRTLSRAILKYPRYAESYLARGQIYIFQKKWDKALVDFKRVISLMPTNGIGFLGQGDALKGIGNFSAALDSYSAGIE